MAYSIELYFDHPFEAKIRQLWERLAENGIPSILHQIGSRPHLSLAVLETLDEAQASDMLEDFSRGLSPFPIEFPAISLIPGKRQTVFLAPAASRAVLELQEELHRSLRRNGFIPRNHYRPDRWLPHCTLSKELVASDALKTVEVCQQNTPTGTARVTELGFIEFRPRREITTIKLSGSHRLDREPTQYSV